MRLRGLARWCLLLALPALLVACAGMPERLAPGTPRAEIEQRLGRPTAEQALAGGTQLQYSRQPAGQQVYNLRLDAQGRLLQVEQVMDRAAFEAIGVDRWTREQVLQRFGRPALVERVARFDGNIWTYRFLEITLPRQAHVHIDPAGTVRQVMFTDEMPRAEPPDWIP
jgi:hypothetical protein